MEVIKRWLNGSQSFVVGRLYYKQFGKNKVLQQLLDNGETPFAKTELIKALTLLLTEEKKPEQIPEIIKLDLMPKGTDDITTSIELEWRPSYQRMKFLTHQLHKYGADNSEQTREQCRLMCLEILQLEQACMKCWEKLDHYKLHGKLPEVKEEKLIIPDNPLDLAILIQTLKRNIRRNKEKAKKNPVNSDYPARVAMYENYLHLAMQSHLVKPKL